MFVVKMCETGSGGVAGTSVDQRHHSGGAQHAERRNANLNQRAGLDFRNTFVSDEGLKALVLVQRSEMPTCPSVCLG